VLVVVDVVEMLLLLLLLPKAVDVEPKTLLSFDDIGAPNEDEK
jgi:hypothetical protein